MTRDQPVGPTLATIDPPEHVAIRSKVRRSFLPRNVKRLEVHARALCEQMAAEALERLADAGCVLGNQMVLLRGVTVVVDLSLALLSMLAGRREAPSPGGEMP